MNAEAQQQSAWGLSLGGGAAALARVRLSGGAVVVEEMRTAPLAEGLRDAAALRRAVGELRVPAGEAVWVAIDDEEVLFHALSLPRVERSAMAAMVRSQAEVILPAGPRPMAWGWCAGPAGDGETVGVLMGAAAAELLDRVASAVEARAVMPGASAVAARIGTNGLIAHVTAAGVSVMRVEGGAVTDCRTCEGMSVRAIAGAARPMQRSGDTGVTVVADAEGERARAAVEAALGLRATLWQGEGNAAVVGAALHGLRPSGEPLLLRGSITSEGVAHGWRPGRLAAAAGVAVAAVLAWYGLDRWQAGRMEARVEALRSETQVAGGTAQALAIGKYLQGKPTPPLLVLESVSRAISPQAQLKELHYDGAGRLRIMGTVRSVAELDKTLQGLSSAAALSNVDVRSANPKDDNYTFEVEAAIASLHRYLGLRGTEKRAAPKEAEPARASGGVTKTQEDSSASTGPTLTPVLSLRGSGSQTASAEEATPWR